MEEIKKLKVLDLFAGLGGWSQAFKDRGHDVFTVDWDEKFDVDYHVDLMSEDLHFPWMPDIILASPPCEKFSVMTIGRNWNKDNTPKTEEAFQAMRLVMRTQSLIKALKPKFWIIENPRGKLRKLSIMDGLERRTVTYCKLGEKYMKPTDLWGGFPPSLELPTMCKNGDPCHIAAPRGSTTGIQGPKKGRLVHEPIVENPEKWKKPRGTDKFRGGMIEEMARYTSWSPERKELSAIRAKIPYQLSELICLAAERDINESNSTEH